MTSAYAVRLRQERALLFSVGPDESKLTRWVVSIGLSRACSGGISTFDILNSPSLKECDWNRLSHPEALGTTIDRLVPEQETPQLARSGLPSAIA